MLSLPAEIACTRSKPVRRETNLIPTAGGRGGLRWCNEASGKTGGRRSKPSIDWPWSTSAHGLRFVACLFREPVYRRSRSVDILDTFTINVNGRVADGLCRAPAECLLSPKFGTMLGELWRALTDTWTEANPFSRFALTMSKEGFDISRNRGKDRLEVEAALHIHTSGWLQFLLSLDLAEKDVEISAPSDHVCAVEGQRETSIPATATKHQVTPRRVLHYGCGHGALLTCLAWSSGLFFVAVVSVRSKPVLVKRVQVSPWSQRIVSDCVPTMCCKLVSQCSHHDTQAHAHNSVYLNLCDRAQIPRRA